eukprot:UN15071
MKFYKKQANVSREKKEKGWVLVSYLGDLIRGVRL